MSGRDFGVDMARYQRMEAKSTPPEANESTQDIVKPWDAEQRRAYRRKLAEQYDDMGWAIKKDIVATGVAETFHFGTQKQGVDLRVRGSKSNTLEGPIDIEIVLGAEDTAPRFLASGGDANDNLCRAQELYNRGRSFEQIIMQFGH